MPYKVLLVGNGAREHAIAKKIVEDNGILFSYMSKENPGIADLSQKFLIGDLNDFKKLDHFKSVDYAIVGPEQPLTEGIADYLEEKLDIPTCSPRKVVSQIESSKIYARKLLDENNLPSNPKYRICNSLNDFKNAIKEFGIEVAIKPDGLTGGKGVRVYGDHFSNYDQAKDYVEILQRQKSQFIVEEKLVGKEFSLQTYSDGKTLIPMPIVKDYKRAFDGDKGPNCYSSDTEILSENGWKTFDKLEKNAKVMTFDPENRFLKFKRPEKIYWMKYEGEMIHFNHRELDLLVTPNHRMLVKSRKSKKIEILEAENLIGEKEIFLSGIWKGESPEYFTIDEYNYGLKRKLEKLEIKFVDWIRFMGLYLSEGYVTNRENEHRVYICQTKNSKHFNDFEKILSKIPFNYSYREEDSKFRINSIQLVNILKDFGKAKEKFVPDYIRNAKNEHIKEFLNAFWLGDGSLHNERMRFHSSSRKLIDDIQELVLKTGKSSIITVDKRTKMLNPINKKYYDASEVYSLGIKPETKVGIRKKDIKKTNYQGYVGCVDVSMGFVVVRRNNRVAVSGNTGSMGSYSLPSHSLPFLSNADTVSALKIMKKTVEIIHKKTSFSYIGVLYGQFMKTDNGIFLVEFNARFGDPEALNVLKIQETGFNRVCLSMIDHNLKNVTFSPLATSCVYLVPEGYPTKPLENQFIEVKDSQNYDLYYASVYRRDNQIFTTKSRAIAVVGTGTTLQNARESVMANIPKIKGKLFHREDIGLF